MVHSHLLCGLVVWGSTFSSYLKKLNSIQNKAIKLIGGGNYVNRATTYCSKLNILKLPDIYKLETRGGVEDTRLEAKAKDTKKNPRPRPRTALPRTDPLEAKDRPSRGQGPRTQAQVFPKKKVFKIFFQVISKKKVGQKFFFRRSPVKNAF